MRTARWSISLAVAVALGVGAVWLLRHRLTALGMIDSSNSARDGSALGPTGAPSIEAAIGELAPVLRAGIDDAARLSWCTGDQGQQLAGSIADRVRFTLAPSQDRWREVAASFGAQVPKHPVHDDRDISPDEFVQASQMLARAQYTWREATVRALYLDGVLQPNPDHSGSFGNAMFRATYPRPANPESDKVTVLEAVIPATITQADGTESRVRVGFSFWWQRAPGRWVPWDVTVYFPPGRLKVKGHVL